MTSAMMSNADGSRLPETRDDTSTTGTPNRRNPTQTPPVPVLTIVETTQSRSAKIPTLGVLLSLVAASFRSLFSGLGLVGA